VGLFLIILRFLMVRVIGIVGC